MRREEEARSPVHVVAILAHQREQLGEDPVVEVVDLVVADRDLAREHLVDVDERAAREVARRDDEIDRLYHGTFNEMLGLMRADPENVERGTRILFAAHYLERIGDRVTNIAEDIVLLATGEIEDLNP